MGAYGGIFLVAVRELLVYPQQLLTTALLVPTRLVVLLLIYSYAFSYRGEAVNGITASVAIWSIVVYQILLFTQFRGIFRTISAEIKQGILEVHLNKPYQYLLYKFWEQLGKGLPIFLVSLLTAVPILLLLTGGPQVSLNTSMIVGGILLMFGGTLVSACLYILISLPALWIDDAEPFFWIVDKAVMILGGAYIPIALLPDNVQFFASVSPFGAPMFATQMFNPSFSSQWVALLTVQAFWISFFLLMIILVFHKAQKSLSVNGG
ncbi:MAG: hypothetical protein AAB553_01600 [Patescibacteria group bacterium]